MRKELIRQGWDLESADIIVSNLEAQIENAEKAKAKEDMLVGGLCCFGGIIVTVASYSAASGGGTYTITWGAILFGAIKLIKGASRM